MTKAKTNAIIGRFSGWAGTHDWQFGRCTGCMVSREQWDGDPCPYPDYSAQGNYHRLRSAERKAYGKGHIVSAKDSIKDRTRALAKAIESRSEDP